MNKKPLYKNYFGRDFSLILFQIWWRGEVSDPKIWTNKKQPYLPYIVFENIGPVTNGYYDPDGIKWCEQILIDKVEETGSFDFAEITFRRLYDKLAPICKKAPALNRKDLIKFLKDVESLWPWFEALWWGGESVLYDKYKVVMSKQFSRLKKLRDESQPFVPGTEAVIQNSLRKIYPPLGDLISVINLEELISGKIPSKIILEKRIQGYFFTDNKLFVGKNRKFIEKKYHIELEKNKITGNEKEIKGNIAHKGVVKGIVRIVYGTRQIKNVGKGDIIVAPMTLPDIMLAMKKASAFVTDEGGIICHAAIIAREMKKPCIIGTKIATKVLKEGDLVEVDADKGVIKILKKS